LDRIQAGGYIYRTIIAHADQNERATNSTISFTSLNFSATSSGNSILNSSYTSTVSSV